MEKEESKGTITHVKYSQDEVKGRMSSKELEELNSLVDEYDTFSDDEDSMKYKRWMELNKKASGG